MTPITIALQGLPTSSAVQYLTKQSPKPALKQSELLKSIRAALSGTGTDVGSTIYSSYHSFEVCSRPDGTGFRNGDGNAQIEEELTWDARIVTLSSGGVIRKKWSFEKEGQSVQWACAGFLEQTKETFSLPTAGQDLDNEYPILETTSSTSTTSIRPTFGPFSNFKRTLKSENHERVREPAIFVFLRSTGKIYLRNGTSFTFSLPFIVRKAWPLYPHGVMVQRVWEPSELEESEATGDPMLPTVFSVTSPFSEAETVGLTTGIIGGFHNIPASLVDEEDISAGAFKCLPPSEIIVSVSRQDAFNQFNILLTIDEKASRISLWRYIHVKPKQTPPFCVARTRAKSRAQNRLSTAVGSQRHSALYTDVPGWRDRDRYPLSPGPSIRSPEHSPPREFPDIPLFSKMAPSVAVATMDSIIGGKVSGRVQKQRNHRASLARSELSLTLDKMAIGTRSEVEISAEGEEMTVAYWVEKLHSEELSERDVKSWRKITLSPFDHRWDGKLERSLLSLCLPASQQLKIYALSMDNDEKCVKFSIVAAREAISALPLRATRQNVQDLLIVKPSGELALLSHGTREFSLDTRSALGIDDFIMDADYGSDLPPVQEGEKLVESIEKESLDSIRLNFNDGSSKWASVNLIPNDVLTRQCLQILAQTIPSDEAFSLHKTFLEYWSEQDLRTSDGIEFDCFRKALAIVLQLYGEAVAPSGTASWDKMSKSSSFHRFQDDPVLKNLCMPSSPPLEAMSQPPRRVPNMLGSVLCSLHTLAESLRLKVQRYDCLLRLTPIICRIALIIRPEWADYWKRLCPEAMPDWPWPPSTPVENLEDRIPVWPPDISAILYGRISIPDWNIPAHDAEHVTKSFKITPSLEYGRLNALSHLDDLTTIYKLMGDTKMSSVQERSEAVVQELTKSGLGKEFVDALPLGIAAPIREEKRTCQLAPPGHWSASAYATVGRDDLAACVGGSPGILFDGGYKRMKTFISAPRSTKSVDQIITAAKALGSGEVDVVSGIELGSEDFTNIRFGQDRRLEEIARMLCSSTISNVKIIERPELNEHDQAKEQQLQVSKIAERTLALSFGRAIFTYGTISNVTREAHTIPKLEFTVRLQPMNITAAPEVGKIPQECLNWGEFHNGVAAGLRIAPTATGVESSWIAFNKPSELTPEHAGFLFGLGLTGHLREMLTWHTFGYLTPKHDLTSIGVLLGLSAANVGTGDRHVTKLLAVHTPALLPTPAVDLNVSLMTQAAGVFGVGLLYMGTRNRRMAEVCLNQISRRDLVHPDLSNEHREAYTYSAALAFGMIMLGKGTLVPADMTLVSRLAVLVHGDAKSLLGRKVQPQFDINLTSPAATIALGLMYLRTERQDIACILSIPDTVIGLNRVQPSFLLMRTVARSLVMWENIAPTNQWLMAQIPPPINKAMEQRFQGKPVDDALELAYYNILAGCCFSIGLKFAGTARQEAYLLIISHFDLFSRLVYSNGSTFDHRIKRVAVREGLNLISISLSMVMAGTGEITCLRRLRYAYGMYHQAFRYGIYVATHLSLGLLFLGGGRYTLGTSNAAIASMVTAFFPRFHHVSSDNKSYLQALRHLWVLAVEPRCLVARDVDTAEVVYLPVKIRIKEAGNVGTTQLISPTLIPDLSKLLSIRVDTPRYWPFYLDIENLPRHKETLLHTQTLYVKRRTAFLSYTEDPRGCRSLFVRSGQSAGDTGTLDFPQLLDVKKHPAGDLSQFITSFSNDVLFLAFADHFSHTAEDTEQELLFHTYCHANLLDSIMQDKPQTLQSHLILYQYRHMVPTSRYFHLRLQDLRFTSDFYSKVFDRRFSGRSQNNPRVPLIRETTISGTLHAQDLQLDQLRANPQLHSALGKYALGERVKFSGPQSHEDSSRLAWYLVRNGVPVSTLLIILRGLAQDAHNQCLGMPQPDGTSDPNALEQGIKAVLHGTGSKMTTALGSSWSVRSLNEILEAWKIGG